MRVLDEKKLFPIKLTQRAQATAGLTGSRKVSRNDIGVLYGQLADLIKAGVPLLRSLETLGKASRNPIVSEMIREISDAVSSGQTFADALAKRPESFPMLHVAMVRAGERGGFIEDVLASLAVFIERQDELASKVTGAMVYPMILTTIGTLVMVSMLIFLVPQFKQLFQGQGIQLPILTRILFALSDMLHEQWLTSLLVLAAIVAGVTTLMMSQVGQALWDRYRMNIPIFGSAIRMTCITRFCRIMGTMLANGVPLLQALAIAKDAAGSIMLARSIEQAAESVRAGQTLAQPLRESGMFPDDVLEMIAVAEESNQLEKTLMQIADTVERKTNRKLDQVVRLVEPLILIVIAIVIGMMAMGLLFPIFNMASALK